MKLIYSGGRGRGARKKQDIKKHTGRRVFLLTIKLLTSQGKLWISGLAICRNM